MKIFAIGQVITSGDIIGKIVAFDECGNIQIKIYRHPDPMWLVSKNTFGLHPAHAQSFYEIVEIE